MITKPLFKISLCSVLCRIYFTSFRWLMSVWCLMDSNAPSLLSRWVSRWQWHFHVVILAQRDLFHASRCNSFLTESAIMCLFKAFLCLAQSLSTFPLFVQSDRTRSAGCPWILTAGFIKIQLLNASLLLSTIVPTGSPMLLVGSL